MECPFCGTLDAYVGLARVKCPNEHCVHFDERYMEEMNQVITDANATDDYEVEDTDPTWIVDYLNNF